MSEFHQLPFPVAVDTLDGSLHHRLDLKPSTLVIIDRAGTVAFRSVWAGDHRDVRAALDAVADGRPPARTESRATFGPMSGALPKIMEVTRRGRRSAWADVRRSAPPMALMAWLAARLPFPGDRVRGAVAIGAPVVVMAALVAAVVVLV